MHKLLGEILSYLRAAVYPQFCRFCGRALTEANEIVFCSSCLSSISRRSPDEFCTVCSSELNDRGACGNCIADPPQFTRHISYGVYELQLRAMILLYKYSGVEILKYTIAEYYMDLIDTINQSGSYDCLITVPRDRGRKYYYDHNRLVAELISKRTGKEYKKRGLIKIRSTPQQASLKKDMRMKNLKGSYICRNRKEIAGKKLLLIDDVYTSGSTLRSCSSVLSEAGAEVSCITLAMTPDYRRV